MERLYVKVVGSPQLEMSEKGLDSHGGAGLPSHQAGRASEEAAGKKPGQFCHIFLFWSSSSHLGHLGGSFSSFP